MTTAINVPVVVSTAGIPKASADLKKLLDLLEKSNTVTPQASGRGLQTPPTTVVQSRNPATRPKTISTDLSLQKFIDEQVGPTGLLKKYAKSFNSVELLRKLESGAAFVTTEGVKPIDDLVSLYAAIRADLVKRKSRSRDKQKLLDEIDKAVEIAD